MDRKEASFKGVSVVVNRILHPRIVKAVNKEKWMDFGYKIMNQPRVATLSYVSKGSTLTFFLKQSFTAEDF